MVCGHRLGFADRSRTHARLHHKARRGSQPGLIGVVLYNRFATRLVIRGARRVLLREKPIKLFVKSFEGLAHVMVDLADALVQIHHLVILLLQ